VQFPIWRSASSIRASGWSRGRPGSGTSPCMLPRRPSAAWFAIPSLADVLRVAGLSLPLVAIRTVPDALLRKRLELNRISQGEAASLVVGLPVVLGLAGPGRSLGPRGRNARHAIVQNIVSFWFVGCGRASGSGAGASEKSYATAWRSSERESVGLCISRSTPWFWGRSPGRPSSASTRWRRCSPLCRWTRSPSLQTSSPSDHGWAYRRIAVRCATAS